MKRNLLENKIENQKLTKLKPLHLRIKEYEQTRNRILNNPKEKASSKILKTRERFQRRKEDKQHLLATVIDINTDPRPYAKVSMGGKEVIGLLDSGASVSILGKDCISFINSIKMKIQPYKSNVKTADGNNQVIIGRVNIPVTYKNSTENILFYLVPNLDQEIYLGINFWKTFKIATNIVSTVSIPEKNGDLSNEHQLLPEQKSRLDAVKQRFLDFERHGLGKTTLAEHVIDTGDALPVKQRHYPVSPAVQDLLYKELDRMLELGVIEPSESPWCSPVVLIKKPAENGTFKHRFCLDSRKVNAVTKKDANPLPHIEGLLSRQSDTYFISSVDLKEAFWQIPLEKQSREKTAFAVPGRPLYQFTVMPFGLCNAAQRLCRLMDKVIPARLRESVFVYLDDLLIISPDFDTHITLLDQVAECLRKANLTINLKKSKFCFKELKYLGFIVGGGKLKPDPAKIEAVTNFPIPKNSRQVRRLLGMAGWYRRFIKDFSSLTAPLTDTLKKKNGKFKMTDEAMVAFDQLKAALTSAPVLIHPDFKKKFFIQCDASDSGIGAVLFQKDESEAEFPISYFSQKLNSCQRNYTVTEKECMAAVMAVKKFRPYVEGMDFTVITDHASLKWLMNMKDLNGRLARWSLELQSYVFDIEHRKGTLNVVPDTLSRAHLDCLEVAEIAPLIDLESEEFHSEEYQNLISTIQNHSGELPDVKVEENYVYKRALPVDGDATLFHNEWRLWIPSGLTEEVIRLTHEPPQTSHGGIAKTLHRVRQFFYWPNMATQIKNFINKCEICKQSKSSNQILRPPIENNYVTELPFQKLFVDFLGPYPRSKKGNAYVFVVLDHFSKYVFLHPLRSANTSSIIKFLKNEVFNAFGVPQILHSDNGKQFVAKDFQNFLKSYGIRHFKTAYYSPQSNASERVNRTLLAAIRSYLKEDQRDWDVYISDIACALRSSVHSSTGVSPYFVLFGVNMMTHGKSYEIIKKLNAMNDGELFTLPRRNRLQCIREKVQKNILEANEKGAKRYNIRSRNVRFVPGQEVFRRNFVLSDSSKYLSSKLCPKYVKCRIVKNVGKNTYELENLSGKKIGIFHAKDIKQ